MVFNKENESGQALVMVAMTMAVVMGFVGLAVDVGLLYHTRQNVQIAADAAATAAAVDYLFNASVSSAQTAGQAAAAENGFTNGSNGVSVVINMPPTSGPITSAGYAEAIVKDPSATNFMGLFGFPTVNVAARSVAGTPTVGGTCIWLQASTGTGMDLQGAYDINAPNCGIYVNSNSSNAVKVTGNGGTLDAKFVDVVGGSVGHQTSPTPITTDVTPRTNPWGNLQGPSYPSGCSVTSALTSITTTNQSTVQGSIANPVVCFANAVTLGNGVTLSGTGSGVVYLFNNGVSIPTGATVTFGSCSTCNLSATPPTFGATSGAVMDLAGGTLSQASNSIVNIYAPTSSTYNGIAILQPSSNTTNNSESNPLQVQFGSNNQILDGYIYAPGSALFLQDNGGGITVSGIVGDVLKDKASTINVLSYDQANQATTGNRVVTLVQ
jgi:putative Flp pilus-assembly TadE/G-like protein